MRRSGYAYGKPFPYPYPYPDANAYTNTNADPHAVSVADSYTSRIRQWLERCGDRFRRNPRCRAHKHWQPDYRRRFARGLQWLL